MAVVEWAENADGTGKWVRFDESGTDSFESTYGIVAKGTVTIDGRNYSIYP